MNKRSIFGLVTATVLTMTACGGGGGEGPQSEEGAVEAVLAIQRGVLKGDADALLDHLSAECKESVDEAEVKLAFGFIRMMMSDVDFDLDDITVDAAIEEFSGEAASVNVMFDLPEGADDSLFGFSDETMDLVYEDGTWVVDECEFGDTSEAEAEDLAEGLAALGYAGTRDEPVPTQIGAPVGSGFTVSIDEVMTDASDYIEAAGGYSSEPEAGLQKVLVRATIGYVGESEPASVGDLSFSIVGGQSAVGVDLYSCGSIPEELDAYGTGLMSGGVASGVICGDVPAADIAGMVVNVEAGYGATSVFFDPMVAAPTPVPVVLTPGPAADGDLSADRQAPIVVGTPTDIGEGWTLTINGTDLDATAAVLAESEYTDPPQSGERFVLVDVSMTYNGEDEPGSAAFVDIDLVGDGNVTTPAGNCQATLEGDLDRYSDVFIGGTIAGTLCFVVADADADSLVALASAGFGEDPKVLAIN